MVIGWQSALPGSNPFGVSGRIIVKARNKMPFFDKKITGAETKAAIKYRRSLCK